MFKSKRNLIFNGIDLAERLSYGREVFIIKDIRGRDYIPTSREVIQVPNKPGGYSKSLRTHPRVLEIEYYLKADSYQSLRKKIEELNGIIYAGGEARIQFADELDRVYYGEVNDASQTDESLKVHQGTLTIICTDPFKYAVTPKTIKGLDVHNQGTTDTPFKLKMTATAPATYLAISNGVKSLGIGKPASNRFAEELKVHDRMNSFSGWAYLPSVPSDYTGQLAINIVTTGLSSYTHAFRMTNLTSVPEHWVGNTLVRGVGVTKDYRIEGVFEIFKQLGEWGDVRQYLLLIDAMGKEIGRMGVSFNDNGLSLFVSIGGESYNQVMINTTGTTHAFEAGVFCKIVLTKKGKNYHASVIDVDKFTGVETREVISSFYTDTLNLYADKYMSSVAYHSSAKKFQTQAFYDLKVYEYVDENTLNPNVVKAGDVIEIDTDSQLILINGQIRKQFKSIESDYFDLKSGKNQLFVNPPVTKNHEITYRERYL